MNFIVEYCYNLYLQLLKYCRIIDNLVTHSIRILFCANSRVAIEKYHVIFLPLNQIYVVGTEKNHLNETVLLSTQKICLKLMSKKI